MTWNVSQPGTRFDDRWIFAPVIAGCRANAHTALGRAARRRWLPSPRFLPTRRFLRTLNELVLPCARNNFNPPVASKFLRQKGALHGNRLVLLESLMAYLSGSS